MRALVVKINNTSARGWRALEEGVDIAMGLSSSPQLLTGYRPVLLIRARRVEAAPRGFVIIMSGGDERGIFNIPLGRTSGSGTERVKSRYLDSLI